MPPTTSIQRYVDALRDELEVQLRRADIERVAAEVESHLLAAVDDAGAQTDEQVAAVVAGFGS